MSTNVYVDGFNLYFRCLRGSRHKWLDLVRLSELLLQEPSVGAIHYFSAVVESRVDDPGQQQRQQAYLRALRATGVEVHLGRFLTHRVRMPLVSPPPKTVEVWKTEEKGSDVNLSTRLLADGFEGRYSSAAVVSNDSDLCAPIDAVRESLGFPVGVVVPGTAKQIPRSSLPGDFYRRIRPGVLAAAQLPEVVLAQGRKIRKPRGW